MKKPAPEVKKELQLLASKLPTLAHKNFEVRTRFSGSSLVKHTTEDRDKKPIDPNKSYLVAGGSHKVDHYKKMRALFMKGKTVEEGWANVNYYFKAVTAHFNEKSSANFSDAKLSNEKV